MEVHGNIRPEKVLVIGVDGATWNVIDPLIAQGKLPNFQRLVKTGVKAKLQSFPPLSTPIIWTTIATGKKPEKHGVVHLLDSYGDLKCLRLWDILESKGLTVGVFGWPVLYPPRELRGFLIPGFFSRGDKTYPKEYEFVNKFQDGHTKGEMVSALGKYLTHGLNPGKAVKLIRFFLFRKRFPYLDRYIHKTLLRTETSMDIFPNIFKRYSPEFAAYYMNHTDQLGHRTWLYYQPEKFDYNNEEEKQRYQNVIPEAYMLADTAIGKLLDTIPKDYHVVILSDHGMKATPQDEAFRVRAGTLLKHLGFEEELKYSLDDDKMMIKTEESNRKMVDDLMSHVQKLRFSSLNEPVFQVECLESKLWMVKFNNAIKLELFNSEKVVLDGRKICELRDIVEPSHLRYSGAHDEYGILILWGSKFRKGVELEKATVRDVTPTILSLYGLPEAEDMDGVVLKDAFVKDFQFPEQSIASYDEKELLEKCGVEVEEVTEDLKSRLKSLGYLD